MLVFEDDLVVLENLVEKVNAKKIDLILVNSNRKKNERFDPKT